MHVTESGVNSSLGSDSVRTSREKLSDTSGFEASFSESESSAETGTTSSDDNSVISVINDGIVSDSRVAVKTISFTGIRTHNRESSHGRGSAHSLLLALHSVEVVFQNFR